MAKPRLLPCPFCGANVYIAQGVSRGQPAEWWIECAKCGVTSATKEQDVLAIDAWNRRSPQSEPRERAP